MYVFPIYFYHILFLIIKVFLVCFQAVFFFNLFVKQQEVIFCFYLILTLFLKFSVCYNILTVFPYENGGPPYTSA